MRAAQIMGIVNVTPDSFSDGGLFQGRAAAIAHGMALAEEGADILDIGGESTRPGAAEVSVDEELSRVIPVIEGITERTDARISIDTRKPEVARAAIGAGASIWNDVSALTFSPKSLSTAVELGVDTILMHAQGSPQTMQEDPQYDNVVQEVHDFLVTRANLAMEAGLAREKIILDPGIGFGKTATHNLELLGALDVFSATGFAVLLGASRKRFIQEVDRPAPPQDRIGGSIAAVMLGAEQAIDIFRVHDVAATRQALAVFEAVDLQMAGDILTQLSSQFE